MVYPLRRYAKLRFAMQHFLAKIQESVDHRQPSATTSPREAYGGGDNCGIVFWCNTCFAPSVMLRMTAPPEGAPFANLLRLVGCCCYVGACSTVDAPPPSAVRLTPPPKGGLCGVGGCCWIVSWGYNMAYPL